LLKKIDSSDVSKDGKRKAIRYLLERWETRSRGNSGGLATSAVVTSRYLEYVTQ